MQIQTLSSRVEIPEHVLFQIMGAEVVLLNTLTEKYFGLDEVAARFWELLSEGVIVSSAVETVLNEYEIDKETVETDLMKLLIDLEEHKLIIIKSE